MKCEICKVKPADPELLGSFGRNVCLDCYADKHIEMEDELEDNNTE
jgi:hypothetical protein